jgi:23S rRNA (cytosine1962-C5)-methyltransferase
MPVVVLKSGRNRRIEDGHPWVYRSEIGKIEGEYKNGRLVRVHNHAGNLLGTGYLNDGSEITVRFLARGDQPVDDAFFRRALEKAIGLRRGMDIDSDALRLVHSEADGLPGLVVDSYPGVVSVQFMTLGMETLRPLITELLQELLSPRTLLNKSDSLSRRLEGLEQEKGILRGVPCERVTMTEGGLRFQVDVVNGHKTGFYLDQRDNRRAAARWLGGLRVLDCFCYSGAFALYACAAGAEEVTGIDSSAEAVSLARENAAMNGFEGRCAFRTGNVFDVLREFERQGEGFDAVILDPPSFGRSRKSLSGAVKGYKEINLRALKILKPGGILVTCTCSHAVKRETFRDTILRAAVDARRRLRLLYEGGQALDHPVVLNIPETAYLQCLVFQVE